MRFSSRLTFFSSSFNAAICPFKEWGFSALPLEIFLPAALVGPVDPDHGFQRWIAAA